MTLDDFELKPKRLKYLQCYDSEATGFLKNLNQSSWMQQPYHEVDCYQAKHNNNTQSLLANQFITNNTNGESKYQSSASDK